MVISSGLVWDITQKSSCFRQARNGSVFSKCPQNLDGIHRPRTTNLVNEGYGLSMDDKKRIRLHMPTAKYPKSPKAVQTVTISHNKKDGVAKLYKFVAPTRPDVMQLVLKKYEKMLKSTSYTVLTRKQLKTKTSKKDKSQIPA